ncbi:hypothetical protein PoB_003696100 [Plakobranchus ocellatus]|uniref:Uncharacterized protein n=1 Tax=Plakobranchus ocellatus TaxID=259542 RepID=A0AAV4AV87_9GAST|nr:hypothetical protein PoB_003696100 [Plakobranchus ocellatus]
MLTIDHGIPRREYQKMLPLAKLTVSCKPPSSDISWNVQRKWDEKKRRTIQPPSSPLSLRHNTAGRMFFCLFSANPPPFPPPLSMHFIAASRALYPPSPPRVLRHLPYPSSAVSPARPPPSPLRVLRRLPCASSAVSRARPPPSPVRVFVISLVRNLPSLLLVLTISSTRSPSPPLRILGHLLCVFLLPALRILHHFLYRSSAVCSANLPLTRLLFSFHAKCKPFSLPTVECWAGHIRIHEQERTWTYFLQRSRMPPITMLQERLMAQDRVGFSASMWEVSSVEKTCKLRKRQRPFSLIMR